MSFHYVFEKFSLDFLNTRMIIPPILTPMKKQLLENLETVNVKSTISMHPAAFCRLSSNRHASHWLKKTAPYRHQTTPCPIIWQNVCSDYEELQKCPKFHYLEVPLSPPAPLPTPTNKKIFLGKPCYIEAKKINVFH